MYVKIMDDHIGNIVDSNAGATGDMDVCAAAVDGFVAVDEEFLVEADGHVGGEGDP